MTPLTFLLILLLEAYAVAGQVLFKRAMTVEKGRRALFVQLLALGIAFKGVEFFLRAGLLASVDLSFLYPFDALNGVVLVLVAWLYLKERTTPRLWLGVGLITAGVALVSAS